MIAMKEIVIFLFIAVLFLLADRIAAFVVILSQDVTMTQAQAFYVFFSLPMSIFLLAIGIVAFRWTKDRDDFR